MKNFILILSLCTLVLCSCNNRKRAAARDANFSSIELMEYDDDNMANDVFDQEHNSRNSLDYAGTYEGTIPCADCEGIKTSLTLTDCGHYVMTSQYMGKGDTTVYQNEGPVKWDADGRIITIDAGDDTQRKFLVGENQIFMLDTDGNRIESSLADHYILRKK